MAADDPTRIRFLAVTVEDAVTALELTLTTSRRAVLRVTPPFSGRMRARLHVVTRDNTDSPEPRTVTDDGTIHVAPDRLIDGEIPPYPNPADTEDALRRDPSESYTVDRHHDRHRRAVTQWRHAVADAVADRVTVPTATGPHEVAITTLGDRSFVDSSKQDERAE